MKKQSQIQIEKELFLKIYSLVSQLKANECECVNNELLNEVEQGLINKLDKIVRHHLYTKSKTAETEEEREKARQEYLDKAGIHKDWRW